MDVQSAGTLGIYGNPATEFAIEAAGRLGADISAHQSQGVTQALVKRADIIFGLAAEHERNLQQQFPEVRDNVFLLRSFDRKLEPGESANIEDPIGRNYETYEECAQVIDNELARILPRLTILIKDKVLGLEK